MIWLGIITSLANFWIWRVFKENLLIGVGLLLLSLTLNLLVIKFNKKVLILTVVLTLFISSQLLRFGFDKNLTVLTVDGEKQLNERHGYFSQELGILFQNKYTLRFYKDFYPYANVYLDNLFNNLSPNLYFFENHPRERGKVDEFAKYPGIFIIPFLVGFLLLFKSIPKVFGWYFLLALLISGLIRPNYLSGPVLFYPAINFLITTGLFKIYRIFRK